MLSVAGTHQQKDGPYLALDGVHFSTNIFSQGSDAGSTLLAGGLDSGQLEPDYIAFL